MLISRASQTLPQLLANLLSSANQPDLQSGIRQTNSRATRPADKFDKTLDRQLDNRQRTNKTPQSKPGNAPPATSEIPRSKTEGSNDKTTGTENATDTDIADTRQKFDDGGALAPGFTITPTLINTPATPKFISTAAQLALKSQPVLNGSAGNPSDGEITIETAPKETTAGNTTGQKSTAQTQSLSLLARELASFNGDLASKLAFDEAKAQLSNRTAEAKSDQNKDGLLQKTLSKSPGLQNAPQAGLAQAAPNAPAYARANANASFLRAAGINNPSAEISQSLEGLSLTPQNSHNLSTRFATAIQSNQSAQTVINSLALQIARHVDQGVNRFQIRMDPPELGRIDVKLDFAQDGRMTANLTVERPETLDLLLRDARALERALAASGLNSDKNSLNFSLKDQSANEYADFKQDAETAFDKSQNSDEEGDIESPIENTIAAYRNLISSTTIDIRI